MRLYDITGDTMLTRDVLLDMRRGDNLTLSSIRATVHLGAHADAPSHYGADAPAIESRDLSLYLGPCDVVRVAVPAGERVTPAHLTRPPGAARVLFATGSYSTPERFTEHFAALAPELIDWLHARGVRLVGIDTPSVDTFSDRTLAAHQRVLAHDMAILEGLVLDGVPDGLYELIALPLKLAGFDASPVRAVLRV
jgi:arylformamidase